MRLSMVGVAVKVVMQWRSIDVDNWAASNLLRGIAR